MYQYNFFGNKNTKVILNLPDTINVTPNAKVILLKYFSSDL